MKKITALVSGHALNFRALRFAATTAALAASAGALLPGTAQAQNYIGNAYALKVGAGVNLNSALDFGVNTRVTVPVVGTVVTDVTAPVSLSLGPIAATGNLAAFGPKETKNGVGVGANVSLSSSVAGLVSLGNVVGDVLGAGVQTTQTTSLAPNAGFDVTSMASLADVGLFNSGGLLNITAAKSLVGATLVKSVTSAGADGSRVGQTIITGLVVNGQSITNQIAGVTFDVNGVVTGSGKIVVNGFTGSRLGELRINEQIVNSDGSLTTNALHLVLDPAATIFSDLNVDPLGLTNTVAVNSKVGAGVGSNAGIIIASSTAGVAPEPGSLALVAAGLLPAAGLLARRRRAAKN